MIDESFLKSNFLGRDGFVWWIGQVADPQVWRNAKVDLQEGAEGWGYRVKVRIIGYHSFSRNELPDNDLPWAHVLTSASDGSPGQGGFGKTPLLLGGESVVGFFLDGEEAQQPVIMSCFHRSAATVNVKDPDPFKPFTGSKGPYAKSGSGASQATRTKTQEKGATKPVEEKLGSGSLWEMGSNFEFSTDLDLDLDAGFAGIGTKTDHLAGAVWSNAYNLPADQLFYDDQAELGFLGIIDEAGEVTNDNGCGDNILAQITASLQAFIRQINGLEQTALGFIDPIRNAVVDVRNTVNSVARTVASLVKFVINAMRDNIFKLVGKLFKLLGITIPSPLSLPISEAAKNILNIIFCLFEKLFGFILDYLIGLLNGIIGKSPNIPRCASEEIVSSLINKLADMIDGALATVLSGLDWLANGISSIAGAITSSLDIISQLLSFLQCDSLACKGINSWDPFGGGSFPAVDAWNGILENMNVLNGLGTPDFSLGFLSVFGSSDTPFQDCRKRIVNPQTQDDLVRPPIGTRFYKCIPPEVRIFGDGANARAKAVVSDLDGSIVTFILCDPGSGYTYPPEVKVVDNSNYGERAQAKAKIVDGKIDRIYIINSGRGYCPTNLTEETKPKSGAGAGTTVGVGTTAPPCIDIGDNRLSDSVVGINTDLIIEKPGIGYTSSDTIQVGNCYYKPILTSRGSVIGWEPIGGACKDGFKTVPQVTINTTTGEGAVIYPVLQFIPQFIVDNPDLTNNFINSGIGSIVNVVDCV